MIKFRKLALASLVASVSAGMTSMSALAQDGAMLEETVTVGTRGKPRSATDSTAAVDVISAADFINQGGVDTANLLRNVVPSFNINDQPISDASTLVRPANLRGMAPDHTLVLVNGKRRHRAAVIHFQGNGVSDGSQGPDIGSIPGLALKSVEILRDGAAAQYGSDAIAGVINFNLKDSDSEGSIEVKYGEYKEGDGETYSIAVNKGFSLGGKGFLNLTGEFGGQEPTDRSVQSSTAAALTATGVQGVPNPSIRWGTPEVEDDIKLWANFAFQINDDLEVFGQANHNSKEVTGSFFYRGFAGPLARNGVFVSGSDFLIGDLTADADGSNGTGGCATVASSRAFDFSGFDNLDDLAAAVASPDCFSFSETFPAGFTPDFTGKSTDQSLLIGFRGVTDNELSWEVSGYYGEHETEFSLEGSINASLGPNTPVDFELGSYIVEDNNLTADFGYQLSDDLFLAFGAEYREETFTITEGDPASYAVGPLSAQGFASSANGFAGFSPQIAGEFSRENYAVYVDSEWDVTDSILIGAAVRYEDFEDFGDTTNFKLGANWAITDTFGARATVSTGFKAPTPGQANTSNITTAFTGGELINQGTIPSTDPVAQQLGGKELTPEESTSFTAGIYFSVGDIDITVDYFDIDLEDRLALSETRALSAQDQADLLARGIDASAISQVRFFTNSFDTNTSGIDIIATTDTEWLGGITTWNLAANYTDTEVTSRDSTAIVSDRRVEQIEGGVPDTRVNVSGVHNMDAWRFLARVNYYGEHYYDDVRNGDLPASSSNGIFDAAYTVDLEVGYQINENLDVSFGGSNILDETGCDIEDCSPQQPDETGLQSSEYSPFGINGAYYYGRLRYNF
jgi:iron complex outermembrane receptor protein